MTATEERLRAHGLTLPEGFSIVSYDERRDLDPAIDAFHVGNFEPFMSEDEIADTGFHAAYDDRPEFQFILLDPADRIVGVGTSMPLWWDGSDDGLPAGWDDQILHSLADREGGREPNTLGAILIIVARGERGAGHSGTILGAFRAAARAAGYRAVIACVRPTWKERYPLTPIERYAAWRREDGLPYDPWIRLHVRLGGRIVRPSPESMVVRGSVADWRSWTGLDFLDSGPYVIRGGTSPVTIDLDRDEGVYFDQNVWVVHDLG